MYADFYSEILLNLSAIICEICGKMTYDTASKGNKSSWQLACIIAALKAGNNHDNCASILTKAIKLLNQNKTPLSIRCI